LLDPDAAAPNGAAARKAAILLSGTVELAFLGHALKRFGRAFDAILVIFAVGREKLHDPIGSIRRHMAEQLRDVQNALADRKLVLVERASLELERHGSTPFIANVSPASPGMEPTLPRISLMPQCQYTSNFAARRKISTDQLCRERRSELHGPIKNKYVESDAYQDVLSRHEKGGADFQETPHALSSLAPAVLCVIGGASSTALNPRRRRQQS
jgi:hypothetical protein